MRIFINCFGTELFCGGSLRFAREKNKQTREEKRHNYRRERDEERAVGHGEIELLRCNFIMRGVALTPGAHTVQFNFSMPNKPLFITLAAIIIALCLAGLLVFLTRKPQTPAAK